jgi:hypothetical protein
MFDWNIGKRVFTNVKRFYAYDNSVKYYIKENDIIFPPNFSLTQGQQPGKGSYLQKDEIIAQSYRVIAILKAHIFIKVAPNNNEIKEVILFQRETWSWNFFGKLKLKVDFLDINKKPVEGDFEFEVLSFNEYNIDLKIVQPLPSENMPPNAPEGTFRAVVNVFQTNLKDAIGVDVINAIQLVFYNEKSQQIGEQLMPKYISISTNPNSVI